MKKYSYGFTLVELMIVVVILSILATVGFISYEDYLVDTRDSKRLAQLTGLRDGLRLATTRGKLPLPDDNVEIRNNGNTFLYQGFAGEDVLSSISYSDSTIDPLDDTYYTYLLSNNRKDFQLMGFLEKYNQSVISLVAPDTNAAEDYSQRYPNTTGKKLGIVLEQDTNTPLQEMNEYITAGFMDLQDTTTNLFDAYITDTYLISGKESDLIGIIPFTTCKKILETGGSYGNGIYNINPSGLNPFEVYCNMEIDGGGWTLVGRSIAGASIGDFGWLVSSGNTRDDSSIYSLGKDVEYLRFGEILLTTYNTGKDISKAFKVSVNPSFIQDETNYLTDTLTSNCTKIFPTSPWVSPCDSGNVENQDGVIITKSTRQFTRWWGFFTQSDGNSPTNNRFHFRNGGGTNYGSFGLARNGYIQGDGDAFGEDYFQKQGMIFVR